MNKEQQIIETTGKRINAAIDEVIDTVKDDLRKLQWHMISNDEVFSEMNDHLSTELRILEATQRIVHATCSEYIKEFE